MDRFSELSALVLRHDDLVDLFDDATDRNDGEEMCVYADQLREVEQRLALLRCNA